MINPLPTISAIQHHARCIPIIKNNHHSDLSRRYIRIQSSWLISIDSINWDQYGWNSEDIWRCTTLEVVDNSSGNEEIFSLRLSRSNIDKYEIHWCNRNSLLSCRLRLFVIPFWASQAVTKSQFKNSRVTISAIQHHVRCIPIIKNNHRSDLSRRL